MHETLSDLVSKLERAHSAFCETLVELGETDRLDERPAAGEWNAREVAAHQMNSERWLRAFAKQSEETRAPLPDPTALDGQTGSMTEFERSTLSELVRLLESERESTLGLLAQKSEADLDRACGTSPWGEELTLGRCLAVIIAHQSRHSTQLAAILRRTPTS